MFSVGTAASNSSIPGIKYYLIYNNIHLVFVYYRHYNSIIPFPIIIVLFPMLIIHVMHTPQCFHFSYVTRWYLEDFRIKFFVFLVILNLRAIVHWIETEQRIPWTEIYRVSCYFSMQGLTCWLFGRRSALILSDFQYLSQTMQTFLQNFLVIV